MRQENKIYHAVELDIRGFYVVCENWLGKYADHGNIKSLGAIKDVMFHVTGRFLPWVTVKKNSLISFMFTTNIVVSFLGSYIIDISFYLLCHRNPVSKMILVELKKTYKVRETMQ